jgi:hypothetical protein
VAKLRFDVHPRLTHPFNISQNLGDIRHVVPHIPEMWKKYPDFKEEMINGRVKSHDTIWEAYTLGGAMIQNPPEYYKKVDPKKVLIIKRINIQRSYGC